MSHFQNINQKHIVHKKSNYEKDFCIYDNNSDVILLLSNSGKANKKEA